jgi:hypothetical protein
VNGVPRDRLLEGASGPRAHNRLSEFAQVMLQRNLHTDAARSIRIHGRL